MFDIVLVEPEIPPNAGNAIRLAANTGARLHLVEPLGFSLDDRQPRLLLDTAFNERAPSLSPDGRWLAYSCDESGRREVYVQAFPDLGAKRQVSTDGGDEPVWSRDGKELFYRHGDDMMAVAVRLRPAFDAEVPRVLFQGRYLSFPQRPGNNYTVAADGRFLMVKRDGPDDPPLTVIVDWTQELLSRLPAVAERP